MAYHSVFRNMLVLALGSGGAKLLGLLAMPVLTRLFLPESFGVMSAFVAISVISAPILTLRYAMSIPVYARSSAAVNAVFLSLIVAVFVFLLLAVLLLFWWGEVVSILKLDVLAGYFWLFLVSILLISINEVVVMWFTRKKRFKALSLSQIAQAFSGVSLKLMLGFAVGGPKVLVLGQMVQQSTAFLSMLREFMCDMRENIKQISLRRMKRIAYLQRGYPLYRLPSHFFMAFSMQSPVLFVAALYGAGSAGQMGLAVMALALPVSIVGQTAGQAFYAEIAKRKKEKGAVYKVTKDVALKLFLLASIPTIILYVAGEALFVIAFGGEWIVAGQLASIMSVYLAAQFIANPLTNIFNVVGRQDFFLYLNVVRALVVLSVFLFLGGEDVVTSIQVYSWAMFVYYAINVFFIIKVANSYEKR